MTLPDLVLDDRGFQSLVIEARQRIADTCPEWTEHNVSDPGVTLIEIFAWMTELLLYRVNQIPEKLQRALMNLLEVELAPPHAAETRLRFTLAGAQPRAVPIPAGTEVVATADPAQAHVIFTVRDGVVAAPRKLAAVKLDRSGDYSDMPVTPAGVAHPVGGDHEIFSATPPVGDALLLGIDDPIADLILDVNFVTQQARGTAVEPSEPPLEWEVSGPARTWLPIEVLDDTTGGFNFTTGRVALQIPSEAARASVDGSSMYWVRCRVADAVAPGRPQYLHAPRIDEIRLSVTGAMAWADHERVQHDEFIGHSDGTPAQRFALHHQPVLRLDEGEAVEVNDPQTGESVPWTRTDSLADCTALDQVYTFDPVAGEVHFGVAVRVPGGWHQFGAIPPAGARIKIGTYRYGGGSRGNVAPGTLTRLRSAIAGVAAVTNPEVARGGVDAESVAEARVNAPKVLRTRERAVTSGDYELLVRQHCTRVARVRCGSPQPGKAIPVYVLPKLPDAARRLDPEEMASPEDLLAEVRDVLEARCVLGVSVNVTPVALRFVTAAIEVRVARRDHVVQVERQVADALYRFLNPYVGGNPTLASEQSGGWPWGRSVHAGELAPLLRIIPAVTHIDFVRLYEVDPATGLPAARQLEDGLHLDPDQLLASGEHRIHAIVDGPA